MWVKRTALSSAGFKTLYGSESTGSNYVNCAFYQDTLYWTTYNGTTNITIQTSQVFRDVSAWYHIVVAVDTTQATDSNRVRLYVNGSRITAGTFNYPTQNQALQINTSSFTHKIGFSAGFSQYFDGYMTEINFLDGYPTVGGTPYNATTWAALNVSTLFGETDTNTGVWKPKVYTGSYGTNGFELSFADNSNNTAATLGKDYSGNGNNLTPNNFSVTAGVGNDSMVDSPTAYGTDTGVGGEVRGNYATWNRLQTSSSITLNNGNLDGTISGGFLIYSAAGTIEVKSGKWYYETVVTAGHSTAYPIVGVCDLTQVTSGINTSFYSSSGSGNTTGIIAHATGTSVYLSNNTSTTDGVSYNKTSDVLMIAFDSDLGKVWFGKNGTWNNSSNPATNSGGHTFSTVSGNGYRPYVQCNADTSNSWTSNFGQRAFAYTAPSGFKALCTTNLPTPTIGATSTTQANKYFNVLLYAGNNASPRSLTGLSFAPDFGWLKRRTTAVTDHQLFDIVRGISSTAGILKSNTTDAETSSLLGLGQASALTSDGFTVIQGGSGITNVNSTGDNYVSWLWNAGGSNATNTSGTITSTVRANTTAGFSIVTYPGNDLAAATVGHGLGTTPSMIIVKTRTFAAGWNVYHRSLPASNGILLNATNAQFAASTTTGGIINTSPTSTTFGFTAGTSNVNNVNANGHTYVAYCFAEVPGYSVFGSYASNNSADNAFVYCGFRPRWIMIKSSSTGGTNYDWLIFDTARMSYNYIANTDLRANLTTTEGGTARNPPLDILSNGFKVRGSGGEIGSSTTYIYAAFAETPFKYALAR
jgi:hypothetical protein